MVNENLIGLTEEGYREIKKTNYLGHECILFSKFERKQDSHYIVFLAYYGVKEGYVIARPWHDVTPDLLDTIQILKNNGLFP